MLPGWCNADQQQRCGHRSGCGQAAVDGGDDLIHGTVLQCLFAHPASFLFPLHNLNFPLQLCNFPLQLCNFSLQLCNFLAPPGRIPPGQRATPDWVTNTDEEGDDDDDDDVDEDGFVIEDLLQAIEDDEDLGVNEKMEARMAVQVSKC